MPSKIALTNQRTWTISQASKRNSKLHSHLRHPDSGLGELPWNARDYAKHKPALGPFRTFRQHGFKNNSRSKLICCWKSLPSINGRYGGKGTNQIASEVAHWCISLCSVAVCWKVFVGVMILYDLDQTSCHFTNFLMTFWLRYTFHCWINVTHRIQIPRPCSEKKQHAGPWTLARQVAELLRRRRELPVRWRHRSKSWYLSIKIAGKIIFISPKQGIVLIRAFWSILIFGLWGAQ